MPEGASDQALDAALAQAMTLLSKAGVASPQADAELLAGHVLGMGRGEVRAAAIRGISVPEKFMDLVSQRAQRIPVQHLMGKAPFRYLELEVGPGAFTPRPETELLAQLAIDAAQEAGERNGSAPRVVDLGTGSGAIAAAVAEEVPTAQVYAVEVSELAYAWAERNLRSRGVALRLGDFATAFPELEGCADVVVSNPPYIPDHAVPQEVEVAEHDPQQALYGGTTGLELPAVALSRAVQLLRPGGYCAMEHGREQGDAMITMFREAGLVQVRGHRDLNDLPRATSGVNEKGFLQSPE